MQATLLSRHLSSQLTSNLAFLGETSHRERTLLHLKGLTSLAERFRLLIDCVSVRPGDDCALTQNLCWLSCAS